MTGWIESWIPYPRTGELHADRVHQKRHVIGDDLHDRVRRPPAVLCEPGVIGPARWRSRARGRGRIEPLIAGAGRGHGAGAWPDPRGTSGRICRTSNARPLPAAYCAQRCRRIDERCFGLLRLNAMAGGSATSEGPCEESQHRLEVLLAPLLSDLRAVALAGSAGALEMGRTAIARSSAWSRCRSARGFRQRLLSGSAPATALPHPNRGDQIRPPCRWLLLGGRGRAVSLAARDHRIHPRTRKSGDEAARVASGTPPAHADRPGQGCPSAPAMRHSSGAVTAALHR